MIPQEQRDLADALIAELGHHALTDDQAVAMAGRMIEYMKRQGYVLGPDYRA